MLTQFLIHCQKTALSEETIRTRFKVLRTMLNHGVDLENPEKVAIFIHNRKQWSDGHKSIAAYAYLEYCKMKGISWTPPKYHKNETLPFVPTEKEIDALIAGTSTKVSIVLQALKETGFRIGELWRCKWTDIDEEKSTIKCRAEKHGKPREQRISAKLISRLNALPKTNEYLFGKTHLSGIRWTFDRQKTALAKKLENPRLK